MKYNPNEKVLGQLSKEDKNYIIGMMKQIDPNDSKRARDILVWSILLWSCDNYMELIALMEVFKHRTFQATDLGQSELEKEKEDIYK